MEPYIGNINVESSASEIGMGNWGETPSIEYSLRFLNEIHTSERNSTKHDD